MPRQTDLDVSSKPLRTEGGMEHSFITASSAVAGLEVKGARRPSIAAGDRRPFKVKACGGYSGFRPKRQSRLATLLLIDFLSTMDWPILQRIPVVMMSRFFRFSGLPLLALCDSLKPSPAKFRQKCGLESVLIHLAKRVKGINSKFGNHFFFFGFNTRFSCDKIPFNLVA